MDSLSDVMERFKRRKALLDNFDRMLDQAAYHRTHSDLIKLPHVKLWDWDSDEGACDIPE